jgi:YVTN family beta-propeller protein
LFANTDLRVRWRAAATAFLMLSIAAIALHTAHSSNAVVTSSTTAYVCDLTSDAVTPINVETNTAETPIAVGSEP